jgi:hypothetical protein
MDSGNKEQDTNPGDMNPPFIRKEPFIKTNTSFVRTCNTLNETKHLFIQKTIF